MNIHASAVSIEGEGVLLLGPSGSGKSDLALRLIHEGATLIADDRVDLEARAGVLIASAPAALGGILELNGQGLLRLPFQSSDPIALAVTCSAEPLERLPQHSFHMLEGITVPHIHLNSFHASATARLAAYLRALRTGDVLAIDWFVGNTLETESLAH